MSEVKRVLGGRYEIGGKLAEGGMGQVYRGRDLLKNRTVAVKLIAEESEPQVRDRFRREANVLRELEHPSLVKLLDAEVEGREPFLVFEFVEGERLDRAIGGRPMEPRRALALLRQIASALSALHERDVVHRDVKPSNMIVRADGTLCLLDFGTAKHAGDAERTAEQLTTEGFVVGTLQYMPPEALFHDADLAATYDVWATGIVLWEMLVGTRPFADVEAKGMTAFMDTLRTSTVPPITGPLPDLPPPIAALVRGLTHHDPKERPEDCTAVVAWIDEAEAQLDRGDSGVGRRTDRLSRRAQHLPTPASGTRRMTAKTLVMRSTTGVPILPGPERTSRAAIALVAVGTLLIGVAAFAVVHGSTPGGPTSPAGSPALDALAKEFQKDPIALMKSLSEGKEPELTRAQGDALANGQRALADLDPTSAAAYPLVADLMAMEFVEQFASAIDAGGAAKLGIGASIPPGYQQRVVASVVDGERRALSLAADGRGAPAVLKFQVSDPERVTALWLSLSGEALRRGHLVGVRLNEHPLSMGGMDPGNKPGEAPRELRRGIPARMLKPGENRLEARVLGAPPDAPHDAEGLRVTLRVNNT